MLRIFYTPGETDDPERNIIAEASNRLDVGEFQFFQLSYEAWYGRHPDPDWLEPHFFAYLTNDDPPPWVRHYARRILDMDREGALEPQADEYHRFDNLTTAPSRWLGWLIVTATLLVVAVFLSLFILKDPGTENLCFFPPCF